jgi:predicted SprT family Zn-dependent metalloprotease
MRVTVIPSELESTKGIFKKMVMYILKDYCKHFNTTVKKDAPLFIALLHSDDTESDTGGEHINYKSGECMLLLNPDVQNRFGDFEMLSTLAHEIVHYCQYVTGRHQTKSKLPYRMRPEEIEAYGLQEHYAYEFSMKIGAIKGLKKTDAKR